MSITELKEEQRILFKINQWQNSDCLEAEIIEFNSDKTFVKLSIKDKQNNSYFQWKECNKLTLISVL